MRCRRRKRAPGEQLCFITSPEPSLGALEALSSLDLHYPKVDKAQLQELAAAKRALLGGK